MNKSLLMRKVGIYLYFWDATRERQKSVHSEMIIEESLSTSQKRSTECVHLSIRIKNPRCRLFKADRMWMNSRFAIAWLIIRSLSGSLLKNPCRVEKLLHWRIFLKILKRNNIFSLTYDYTWDFVCDEIYFIIIVYTTCILLREIYK